MQKMTTLNGQSWMPVFTPVGSQIIQEELCDKVCHAKNTVDCVDLPCQWNPDKTEGEDKPCIWVKITKEIPCQQ